MEKSGISKMLQNAGIKPTLQKLEICSLIFSRDRHFTMDEIFREANAEYPKVSRATVFNTLNQLTSSGLLRTLHVRSDVLVYDSNTKAHDHIVKNDSGEIEDIQIPTHIKQTLLQEIQKSNPKINIGIPDPGIVIRI